ncbi:transglutaminase-like domain-containing protein [Arthrobacter monumenti]
MERVVSAHLAFTTTHNTSIAMAVAAAGNKGFHSFDETLNVTVDGLPATMHEIADLHSGRMHTITLEQPAKVVVDYSAEIAGTERAEPIDEMDLIRYVRPSRYCESDRLLPVSFAEFGDMQGMDLLVAVRQWVNRELSYVAGSSRPTDGAVETFLGRQGVCRDYAHLVISLLRAKDVPARLAAVYAPGLSPMDFHAVVEAYVDGVWHVIDATGLAPRESMLRITTGRDASDTAFLSTVGGRLQLQEVRVTATVNELPMDDAGKLTQLR